MKFNVEKFFEKFGYYKFKIAPKLEEDKEHLFVRCKYMGEWIGFYDNVIPNRGKLICEDCSYNFHEPEKIWDMYGEESLLYPKGTKSMQIKYFICSTHVNTKFLYTLIYEANVNAAKIWWTYGQELKKEELEGDRFVKVIPTKKLWLKDSDYKGYNIHCYKKGFGIFSPSMDWRQNFVKWHKII